MGKPVITAQTVMQAVAEGSSFISATTDTIVTALAKDVAKEHGITIQRSLTPVSPDDPIQAPTPVIVPSGSRSAGSDVQIPDDQLEATITALVGAALGVQANAAKSHTAPSGPKVMHISRDDAVMEDFPFEGPPPGMRVQVSDVVTADDQSPIAAGYMTLTKGEFPWTLTYDEVQIVLEGELHIGTPEGTKVGKAGDVLYVPKGSSITFGTPNWTKFIYVTFPADWAG